MDLMPGFPNLLEVVKCPLSDDDAVPGYFGGAAWIPGAPLERSPALLLVALFSRLRVSKEEWQRQGGPAGSWASWTHCAAHVKHQGAARGHTWATSSEVHLSGLFFFFFFNLGTCCGSQALPLCRAHTQKFLFQPQPITSQFFKAICSYVHLPLPTPTLKSFIVFVLLPSPSFSLYELSHAVKVVMKSFTYGQGWCFLHLSSIETK